MHRRTDAPGKKYGFQSKLNAGIKMHRNHLETGQPHFSAGGDHGDYPVFFIKNISWGGRTLPYKILT